MMVPVVVGLMNLIWMGYRDLKNMKGAALHVVPLRNVGGKRTQAKEKSQALSAPEPLSKGAANQLM
jgi:hypothetical protein